MIGTRLGPSSVLKFEDRPTNPRRRPEETVEKALEIIVDEEILFKQDVSDNCMIIHDT